MIHNYARLLAAVLGTVALSACVESLWSIAFDVPESNGTTASFVVPGPDDSVLLAGNILLPPDPFDFVLAGDPYVARHASDGRLLWRYRPNDGTSFVGVSSLATAADGSIYFSDMRKENVVLTRLDADGQRRWEYRHPQDSLDNPLLALLVKPLGQDRVLLGLSHQYVSADQPPGTLLALDNQGQVLWSFDGAGSGAFDQEIQFDAEILDGHRIATFFSRSDIDNQWFAEEPAPLPQGGAISLLDADGQVLVQVEQAALGLTTIFDLAPLGNRIAVVGRTLTGSRLLVLDDQLSVLQQRDFSATTTGRVASDGDTLCFALLSLDSTYEGPVAPGHTTLGIIDRNGQSHWETTLEQPGSRAASLTANGQRCAFTDVTLKPGASYPDDPDSVETQTRLYARRGLLDTVIVPGDLYLSTTHHALLQGHALYTATTTFPALPGADPRATATLHKHRVY